MDRMRNDATKRAKMPGLPLGTDLDVIISDICSQGKSRSSDVFLLRDSQHASFKKNAFNLSEPAETFRVH